MRVLDNSRDAKIKNIVQEDLYDCIYSSVETIKPAGEWNQAGNNS